MCHLKTGITIKGQKCQTKIYLHPVLYVLSLEAIDEKIMPQMFISKTTDPDGLEPPNPQSKLHLGALTS